MQLFLGFACAFLLSALSMPLILKFAHRRKLYDTIDERKIHTGNIPRLGGLGIFLAFIVTIALFYIGFRSGISTGGRFWVVLLCMLGVQTIGLADDFVDIRARYKFFLELGAAVLLSSLGFRFLSMTLPFGIGLVDFGALGYFLTILWITGVPNALNLIDGMDGLAGGVTVFTAITYGAFFIICGDLGAALVCLILAGSVCGFLAFNLPPAKIFMGDSGALFLGFSIAVMPLIGPASGHIELGFVPAVTALLIPIYDTFAAIIRRAKAGVSVFTPDRLHLHHKLLDLGLGTKGALAVIYGAQAFLCLISLSSLAFPGDLGFFLNIGIWLLFPLFFVVIGRAAAAKRGLATVTGSELVEEGDADLGSSAALKTSLVSGAFETKQLVK